MPKVLRIVNRLVVGGPTYNVSYLTKYMSPEFETMLVSGAPEKTEVKSNFIYEKIGVKPVFIMSLQKTLKRPWNDLLAYREIKKIIKDFKPDVVHTHASKAGLIGRLAAYHAGVPVVLHTYHGTHFKGYFNNVLTKMVFKVEQYLCKISTGAIAISPQQYEELANDLLPKEKLHLVPLGFDLNRFIDHYDAYRQSFREEFHLDADTITIAIVGRLVPIKNHELFLKGIKNILNKTSKKIKVLVIGDGELRGTLEQLCKDINLDYTTSEDKTRNVPVIFTSWRSDIERINAGIDINVLTSKNEGTPVSIIEAQATHKPVVVSNVGGVEYIVDHGKSGFIFEEGNQGQFEDFLLEIINNDQLRQSMSDHARDCVVQKFSVERLVGDMSQLYRKLLSQAQNNK